MTEVELKAENAALRKQNKNLKALLEEALEIIRKLKEFVDRQPDGTGPVAPPRKTKGAAGKRAVKAPRKTASVKRKAS